MLTSASLLCLQDNDVLVRKNAATAIREIVKHTPELAKLVVNAGTHTHSSAHQTRLHSYDT